MNKIRLVLGDWSDDGHGKSKEFMIESSLKKLQLQEAYKIGAKKIGVSIIEFCSDYEDSKMPAKDFNIFNTLNSEFPTETKDEEVWVDEDLYAKMYMMTCKAGHPELKWNFIVDDEWIDIGGYGLFGS